MLYANANGKWECTYSCSLLPASARSPQPPAAAAAAIWQPRKQGQGQGAMQGGGGTSEVHRPQFSQRAAASAHPQAGPDRNPPTPMGWDELISWIWVENYTQNTQLVLFTSPPIHSARQLRLTMSSSRPTKKPRTSPALDFTTGSADSIADILIESLPTDCTWNSAFGKKLKAVFALVENKLMARGAKQLLANREAACLLPRSYVLSNVTISVFQLQKIFSFQSIKQRMTTSRVSKMFHSIAMDVSAWKSLPLAVLKKGRKDVLLKEVLGICALPQFAQLEQLELPTGCRLGKSGGKQLAKACPHLCLLDVDFTPRTNYQDKQHIKPEGLRQLPQIQQLSGLACELGCVRPTDIDDFAFTMGERLQVLCLKVNAIKGGIYSDILLRDHNLATLAVSCPNLEALGYQSAEDGGKHYDPMKDHLTAGGIVHFLQSCPKLLSFSLGACKDSPYYASIDLFTSIAELYTCDVPKSAARLSFAGVPEELLSHEVFQTAPLKNNCRRFGIIVGGSPTQSFSQMKEWWGKAIYNHQM
jgi:hypothetical protein